MKNTFPNRKNTYSITPPRMDKWPKKRKLATTLFKGLDVLFIITSHPDGIDVPSVVKQLGQPRSNTVWLLDSLEHYGLIERRNRLCYPSDRLPQLLSAGADLALKDKYRPVVDKINAALGELVVLARLKGSELVPIDTVKTIHRVGFDPNEIVPAAYASEKTASGKLLLTQRPDLIRKDAPKKLETELELARKHHIAFNIQDSFQDMVAMATWVDIPAPADPVVSVCWPLYRFNLKEAEKAIAAFREAVPDSAPLKKHIPPLDVFISFYPQLKDL